MSELKGKIDFLMLISVNDANPNGDPLNGNRPRENFDGFGEISDVCVKRKIRNRWQDMGKKIFVQSDDRKNDGFGSLKTRADGCEALQAEIKKGKKADRERC
ncbi:MAG TPA: type I CRISPR-associated protein Cas7, partial [Candidatus Eisenbergiella merdavium]|nr:type I CRISPR-associated protein Cas7 [Candidatus Eisenbergiella merdavium]